MFHNHGDLGIPEETPMEISALFMEISVPYVFATTSRSSSQVAAWRIDTTVNSLPHGVSMGDSGGFLGSLGG